MGALLGLAALCVAIVGALLLAYPLAFRDVIYPNVSVDGVDVGGLTPDAARDRLDRHFRAYTEGPLTLRTEGLSWDLTPAQLGVRTHSDQLAREAFQIGRSGPIWESLLAPVRLSSGVALEATPTLAGDVRDATLARIAVDVDRAPGDARLEVTPAGVRIVEEVAGRRLDREQTARRLAGAVAGFRSDPIDLVVEPVPPAVFGSSLSNAAARAQDVIDRRVVLTDVDRAYPVDPAVVRGAVRFVGSGAATQVDLDVGVLRPAVGAIAAGVDRPARDASLTVRAARPLFDAGQSALAVQVEATAAALRSALLHGEERAPLIVRETPPAVTADRYATAQRELGAVLSGPVVARARDREWRLSPADLAGLVSVSRPADGSPARVAFDRAQLAEIAESWAAEIDRPSISPRLAWNGGAVGVVREGRRGQALQVEEAVAAVERAARSDQRIIDLPVASWGSAVTQADVARLGLRELVADAATSYAGSIPERAHNVELAARLLDGTLVAPGETFSFNRALGPTTIEAGFRWALGIANTGRGVATVPSVAGGICQVATTLFQPVFWTGFPVAERAPHSYWIPKYASRGLPGLDATVDEPSGLDFRFINDTAHHLLIEARADGERLSFALYGTRPDRTVRVLDPVITDRVRADRSIVREPSDWLPAGQTLWSEQAEDGFRVALTRIVTDGDGASRQETFASRYQASRNVLLVGSGPGGGRRAQ